MNTEQQILQRMKEVREEISKTEEDLLSSDDLVRNAILRKRLSNLTATQSTLIDCLCGGEIE